MQMYIWDCAANLELIFGNGSFSRITSALLINAQTPLIVDFHENRVMQVGLAGERGQRIEIFRFQALCVFFVKDEKEFIQREDLRILN